MTVGFVRPRAALRKRLSLAPGFRSLLFSRVPMPLACLVVACATAACGDRADGERAALTHAAARELADTQPPSRPPPPAAFTAPVDAAASNPGAAVLPALAVRTPAQPAADGSASTDPLVTPVIHGAD